MTIPRTICFLLLGGGAALLVSGCAARLDSNVESKLTGIEKALVGIGNQVNETKQTITAVGSQVSSTQNDLGYAKTFVLAGAGAIVVLGVGSLIFLGRTIKATLDADSCKYEAYHCPDGARKTQP